MGSRRDSCFRPTNHRRVHYLKQSTRQDLFPPNRSIYLTKLNMVGRSKMHKNERLTYMTINKMLLEVTRQKNKAKKTGTTNIYFLWIGFSGYRNLHISPTTWFDLRLANAHLSLSVQCCFQYYLALFWIFFRESMLPKPLQL